MRKRSFALDSRGDRHLAGDAATSFARVGNEMVGLDQTKDAVIKDVTQLVDEVSDWISYSMRSVDW